nr:hypothetical protein GCM10025732_22550 [Glycomyces mayteni]
MAYRYFYDTEFIEDGRTIDLVSIAVVDEHGREYYAVSTEFDPSRAIEWVRRNVLDKLPAPSSHLWKDRATIRDELYEFLVGPVRRKTGSHPGERVELWAWIGAYDHVVLAQLWGTMPELPRAAADDEGPAPALGGPGPPGAAGDPGRGHARRLDGREAEPGPVEGPRSGARRALGRGRVPPLNRVPNPWSPFPGPDIWWAKFRQ